MIRKLTEDDRAKVLGYLGGEPAINLFIIGDIEGFGFDTHFQELWADFNDRGDIDAVLLRFHESFIPYSQDEKYDWSQFKAQILEAEASGQVHVAISGKKSVLDKFNDILPNHPRREMFFCELTRADALMLEPEHEILTTGLEDAKRVYDLIEQIDEFESLNDLEKIKQKLETKTGRIYYCAEAGKMVSVAQTTAENSMSAMVVGVATLEAYRGKGYVSACLSSLCKDVLEENKTLCLFYDNPKAGRIYHRLGFETLDKWVMANYVEK